jgi:hypothetical protein
MRFLEDEYDESPAQPFYGGIDRNFIALRVTYRCGAFQFGGAASAAA